VDLFAQPDTVVLAPEDGTVDRLSGHDPREGGRPGGPYGWSIYINAAIPSSPGNPARPISTSARAARNLHADGGISKAFVPSDRSKALQLRTAGLGPDGRLWVTTEERMQPLAEHDVVRKAL
jgi:hypothetical protein